MQENNDLIGYVYSGLYVLPFLGLGSTLTIFENEVERRDCVTDNSERVTGIQSRPHSRLYVERRMMNGRR